MATKPPTSNIYIYIIRWEKRECVCVCFLMISKGTTGYGPTKQRCSSQQNHRISLVFGAQQRSYKGDRTSPDCGAIPVIGTQFTFHVGMTGDFFDPLRISSDAGKLKQRHTQSCISFLISLVNLNLGKWITDPPPIQECWLLRGSAHFETGDQPWLS